MYYYIAEQSILDLVEET